MSQTRMNITSRMEQLLDNDVKKIDMKKLLTHVYNDTDAISTCFMRLLDSHIEHDVLLENVGRLYRRKAYKRIVELHHYVLSMLKKCMKDVLIISEYFMIVNIFPYVDIGLVDTALFLKSHCKIQPEDGVLKNVEKVVSREERVLFHRISKEESLVDYLDLLVEDPTFFFNTNTTNLSASLVFLMSYLQFIKYFLNPETQEISLKSLKYDDFEDNDQVLEDLKLAIRSEIPFLRENIAFLLKFIRFTGDCWIYHDQQRHDLMVCMDAIANNIACALCFGYPSWKVTKQLCQPLFTFPDVWVTILKALTLLLECDPVRNDQLLMVFVNYIQYIVIHGIQHSYARTSHLWNQLKKLHDELGYLVKDFIDYRKNHAEQENLSNFSKHFQAMMSYIGSIIYSFINNMGKDLIRELSNFFVEILDNLILRICTNRLSPYNILMRYVDCFRSIQRLAFSTVKDELKREMATELGLLLCDAINRYLTTLSQVESGPPAPRNEVQSFPDIKKDIHRQSLNYVWKILVWLLQDDHTINLQCSLKEKFESLCRELVFMAHVLICLGKHYVEALNDMAFHLRSIAENITQLSINTELSPALSVFLRVNLKVLILSLDSGLPPDGQLLVGCLDGIQKILTLLSRDEDIALEGPMMDQSVIVLGEVRLLVGLLTNHKPCLKWDDKLYEDRIQIQSMAMNMGSVICSSFNNEIGGNRKSLSPYILVENVSHMKVQLMRIRLSMILNKLGRAPQTDLLDFVNSVIENLAESMDSKFDFTMDWKDRFQIIYEGLVIFRSCILNIRRASTKDDKCQDLLKRMKNMTYMAEYVINTIAVGACHVCFKAFIPVLTEEVKVVQGAVTDFVNRTINIKTKDLLPQLLVPATKPKNDPIQITDVVVGFKDEIRQIMELLASNLEELDAVWITGMPGLGKTTLAKEVYNHPYIVSHFQTRVWCCVSQEYNKRKLMLTILGFIVPLTDEIRGKSFEDLSLMLYQGLFGRRYLIVMDDIWEVDAFEDVKRCFPDDRNGSRIMMTSRNKSIASQAKCHSNPLELRFLTEDESWDLLERKAYLNGKCPLQLCRVGKKIAQKCRGVPLAIVVIAGVLSKSADDIFFWRNVSENLILHFGQDSERVMSALALSYKLLPDFLKPLFLYLGAFPEDKDIPAEQLKRLWIAEGLVHKTGCRSLEDQAEDNLMELIDRSLLMVAERKYNGKVKTCRVHDLLRDLSVAKAEEEMFSQHVNVYSNSLPNVMFYHHRVIIPQKTKSEGAVQTEPRRETPVELFNHENIQILYMVPPLRSLLHFYPFNSAGTTSVFSNFKLLRVLYFQSCAIFYNLDDAKELVLLRYISVTILKTTIPSSIASLIHLETLTVKGMMGEVVVPDAIWRMVKLRHVHINDRARFSSASDSSSNLENLVTLSTPVICYGEEKELIRRFQNLRQLRCIFVERRNYSSEGYQLPQLESLVQLESLKLLTSGRVQYWGQFNLPSTLKKLTLLNFHLQWDEISILQNLPSLEALKLRSGAVDGDLWNLGNNDRFPKLKLLKFESLSIKQWNLCSDNFPCLQKLIFERCKELEEIPGDLGDIYSLEKIELLWCSPSAVTSAMKFREDQEDMGNELLNVHIYPPVLNLYSPSVKK